MPGEPRNASTDILVSISSVKDENLFTTYTNDFVYSGKRLSTVAGVETMREYILFKTVLVQKMNIIVQQEFKLTHYNVAV